MPAVTRPAAIVIVVTMGTSLGWISDRDLSPTPDSTDRVSRALRISPDTPIRVAATIADVSIVGSNRSDVLVDIVRRAPSRADLARYPVSIDEQSDALRIDVVQADETRDAALRTEMTMRVPAEAAFQAIRIFEGRLRLSNLRRACDAVVQRGAIDASALPGRGLLEVGLGALDLRDAAL